MARKKRRFDQVAPQVDPAAAKAEAARYRDPFQEKVGARLEDASKRLEGHGRTILYGLAALAVLGIIVWIIYAWMGRSNAEAQTALGRAIETSQAQVTDVPAPAGSTERTFPTQRARSEAAIAEFQAVADKFGGSVREKARYFIAVNRLFVDRAAAVQELEALADDGGEVGTLSKFALAQAKAGDGKYDEAAALYRDLASNSDPIIPKETINLELALAYEKQGNKDEAVKVLYDMVKAASEAKDKQGEPLPLSNVAEEAKKKLAELDPAKAAEFPDQAPAAGGFPFGG